MEQLVARRAHNPKVVGSSPAPATTKSSTFLSRTFFIYIFNLKQIKYIMLLKDNLYVDYLDF